MKKPYEKKLRNFLSNTNVTKWSIIVFTYILITFVILLTSTPEVYSLKIGDVADQDIDAPSNMVDKAATKIKKDEAEKQVQPIYKLDLTVQIELEGKIDAFFKQIEELKDNDILALEQKIKNMSYYSNIDLDT